MRGLVFVFLLVLSTSFVVAADFTLVNYANLENGSASINLYYDDIITIDIIPNNSVTSITNCTELITDFETFTFTNTSPSYRANITFPEPGLFPISWMCDGYAGAENNTQLLILDRREVVDISSKLSMVSVQKDFELNATYLDGNQNPEQISCLVNVSSQSFDSLEFRYAPVTVNDTYTFDCSNDVIFSRNLSASVYEPKLELVDPPFGSLTSTQGFKMGVYDFNLDYVDDLIILGETFMIFDGNDLTSPALNLSGYDANYEFVVTDMDSDGDGDVLIGSTTSVNLITLDDFDVVSDGEVSNETGIVSFAPFTITNDFYKDLIIVNRTGDKTKLIVTDYFGETSVIEQDWYCEQASIFDINQDFVEDIICLKQSFSDDHLLVNIRTDYGLSNFTTYRINFSYAVSDFFVTDVDSDGDYEVGVISLDNISYFNDELLFANSYNIGATGYFDHTEKPILGDLFANNSESISLSFQSGTNYYLQIYYSGFNFTHSLLTDDALVNNFHYDVDNDGDLDLLTKSLVSRDLRVYQNNISDYRDLNTTHQVNVTADTNSPTAFFQVNLTKDWQDNGYFYAVEFKDKHYRNDVFDSRLNMRWFLNDKSDNYSFDYNNYDLYTVEFAPNTYANILGSVSTFEKPGLGCNAYDETGYQSFITINSTCNITQQTNKNILVNQTFNAYDTRVNWLNITLNAFSLVLENVFFSTISDSKVFVNETRITGSALLINNSLIENNTYVFNSTLTVIESSDINYTLNQSIGVVSTSTGLLNVVNSTAVIYQISDNKTILSSFDSLSTVEYVNCPTILVIEPNGGNSSMIQFNYTNTDGEQQIYSSLSRCYTIEQNNTKINHTFEPITNYLYYPVSVNYSYFNVSENITLEPTFIPTWDYSLNTSHMTDLRNYTLLRNISNVTDFKLSVSRLNLTYTQTLNLTSENLVSSVYVLDNTFYFSYANATVNFTSLINESPILLKNNSPITTGSFDNYTYIGELENGTYTVVNNISFAYKLPAEFKPDVAFNITYNYTDYFGEYGGSCDLNISGVEHNFTNISLPVGSYEYNISCVDLSLPVRYASGEFDVVPFVGHLDQVQYEPFVIDVLQQPCESFSVFVNGTQVASVNSSCQAQIQLNSLRHELIISNSTSSFGVNVSLKQGFSLFDEVIGLGSTGFTNTILLDGFFILNKSSVFIQRNNSEILTDSSVIDFDFKNPITYQDSVFYYSGDLDNNGVIQEVYN